MVDLVHPQMSRDSSSIALERKGYGRGLILGLTMAETFLLLVFCLMLVAAAAITSERKKADEAIANAQAARAELADVQIIRDEAEALRAENRALTEKNDKLENTLAALPEDVLASVTSDEDWRELTLARDVAESLSNEGLSADDALALVPLLKTLKDEGLLDSDAKQARERLDEVFRDAQEAKTAKQHSWPPIINLSEADRYNFAVGSAELTPEFRKKLSTEIADRIASDLAEYNVDIIEVVGHTDEQGISGQTSNLDKTIGAALAGDASIETVTPADNAGLGLARAIAVRDVIRRDPRLARATVLPLSGAQLIMPGDVLSDGKNAGDVKSRRRIEIRMRRRSDQSASAPAIQTP